MSLIWPLTSKIITQGRAISCTCFCARLWWKEDAPRIDWRLRDEMNCPPTVLDDDGSLISRNRRVTPYVPPSSFSPLPTHTIIRSFKRGIVPCSRNFKRGIAPCSRNYISRLIFQNRAFVRSFVFAYRTLGITQDVSSPQTNFKVDFLYTGGSANATRGAYGNISTRPSKPPFSFRVLPPVLEKIISDSNPSVWVTFAWCSVVHS